MCGGYRRRAGPRERPGYAAVYLGLSNYTNNLLHFGFTERDIADGGSDRLIDTVIPHGSAAEIAEVVHAHLEAGADHVCLQPVGVSGVPRDQWTALARALDCRPVSPPFQGIGDRTRRHHQVCHRDGQPVRVGLPLPKLSGTGEQRSRRPVCTRTRGSENLLSLG